MTRWDCPSFGVETVFLRHAPSSEIHYTSEPKMHQSPAALPPAASFVRGKFLRKSSACQGPYVVRTRITYWGRGERVFWTFQRGRRLHHTQNYSHPLNLNFVPFRVGHFKRLSLPNGYPYSIATPMHALPISRYFKQLETRVLIMPTEQLFSYLAKPNIRVKNLPNI